MASGAPAYRVEDRSLLLPYYRRIFVDPILPFLPESLHPNTITHAGHALNLSAAVLLVGLWPSAGWPFAIAALLLQLYLWCDNADGAHARRTRQCSPLGELLDHGLDQLNTAYIGFLTAMALGAPPLWWVAIALLIPGAAVAAYWEQAQTGVFRLGLLNQVESLTVLTAALLASAIFGTQIFAEVTILGVSLRNAMLLWTTSTILFGLARGLARVLAKDGAAALLPIAVWIAFCAAVASAAAVGAIGTVPAVTIATAGNVYMGMRMLSCRMLSKLPRVEAPLALAALVLSALASWRFSGLPASGPLFDLAGPGLAALACTVFGAQAAMEARERVQGLSRVEQATPALD